MRLDYSDDRLELLYAIFRSCTFNQIMEDLANKKELDQNAKIVASINEKIKVFLNSTAQKLEAEKKRCEGTKKQNEKAKLVLKGSLEGDDGQIEELEEQAKKFKKCVDSVSTKKQIVQINKAIEDKETQIAEKQEELKNKQEKAKKALKQKEDQLEANRVEMKQEE